MMCFSGKLFENNATRKHLGLHIFQELLPHIKTVEEVINSFTLYRPSLVDKLLNS